MINVDSPANRMRARAVLISREFKAVLLAVPERFGIMLAARLRGWLWRWLFRGPDGEVHRAGGIVLSDLRKFCHADKPTIFHPDAAVMARREGRREVWTRIMNYLHLDENEVRKLMELDDGRY